MTEFETIHIEIDACRRELSLYVFTNADVTGVLRYCCTQKIKYNAYISMIRTSISLVAVISAG